MWSAETLLLWQIIALIIGQTITFYLQIPSANLSAAFSRILISIFIWICKNIWCGRWSNQLLCTLSIPILPVRRYVNGSRPGITGEDPLGPDTGSQDQWEFPPLGKNGLTRLEKRMVVVQVAQKSVLAVFKTHTYTFANKFFLQNRGGPISLRYTCCLARLVMMWWDEQFSKVPGG